MNTKARFILLVILPSLLTVSTVGIYFFEYVLTGNEESTFHTLFDSLWWTVETITTVGYGDMAPVTFGGRVFTFLIMAAGIVNFSIIVSLVTTKFDEFRSGRERGLDPVKEEGHVLICSDHPSFMEEILRQNRDFLKKGRVALVGPGDEHPLITTPYKELPWVSGNGYSLETLRKVSAEQARVAYVSYQENSLTLMTVLQLKTLSARGISTLAQYTGESNRKHFQEIGCDYALDPYEVYVPLMVQAYRAQGGPSWVLEVVNRPEGHRVRTVDLIPELHGKTWLEAVVSLKLKQNVMPLGVLENGVVLVNPRSEHLLREGTRIMQLCLPKSRPQGDQEEDALEISGVEDLRVEGHLVVSSDNLMFIERMLGELKKARVPDRIVVITENLPEESIPEGLEVNWVQGKSNSEHSFRKAQATEAKVAFIDHEHDGQTLMAVLRLEQETGGEIFTIASYREPDFDVQLMKVGCDFCLKADELTAPILAQTAAHKGYGTLITQILSEEAHMQSLFVRRLSGAWQARSWVDTVQQIKQQSDQLPVGLLLGKSRKLLVNPHPEFVVDSGDSLIFLALEESLRDQPFYEMHHTLLATESEGRTQRRPVLAPNPEAAEALFHSAIQLIRSGGDTQEAYRRFHLAAIQGHAWAKYNLGVMNFNGQGVPKNREEAYYWFRESALSGHEQAQKMLQSIRVLRDLEEKMAEDHPRRNAALLQHLSADHRFWYARAVVAMVMVDGHIDLHERAFLHEAIHMLERPEHVQELEEMILLGRSPKIEPIELGTKERGLVLQGLLDIAVADRDFALKEQELLTEIAGLLTSPPEELSRLIEQGKQRIQQFSRST